MKIRRGSGILLHPTSLPGPFGIGDFGPAAYQFADFLKSAKQSFWQILPLGPPSKGNSPYSGLSAFAGNPLLISPQKLVQHRYLTESDISHPPSFCSSNVEFSRVESYKNALLLKAYAKFEETRDYQIFEEQNEEWLAPFAGFMAWKLASGGAPWTKMETPREMALDEIRFHKFAQYEFFRQWFELKRYCQDRGISIIGDVPFYIEHDSSDVWSHRELFHLNGHGNPSTAAGVPPDYFSATGQLWGNPTYRWDRMRETDYRWWMDRLRAALALFDVVRLDHFRGFEATWEIQAGAASAVQGRWVPGPGIEFFETALRELGELPFVAENLGMITPQVEEIRRRFNFPGTAVLQFGFGRDSTYRPHMYSKDTMACTGTHDNDTVLGWWSSRNDPCDPRSLEERGAERERASRYLGTNGQEIHWAFIRAVMTSAAELAILPLQDVLGLGSEARMNRPGIPDGNWQWRYDAESVTNEVVCQLRELTELCDR